MGSEVIIVPIIFGILFGIVYLFFTTRNKERMALIEKGIGAEIFNKGNRKTAPVWKVFILNLALLLMGIGLGTLLASIIDHVTTLDEDALYPGIIFLTAGTGLLAGFYMTKNLDK
jgi:ABC-type Fe3+-siderophore transport system permease subunit